MNTKDISREQVLQTLTEFPQAGSKTIAEVLVQRHPLLFKSVDQARDKIRYYRGAHGTKGRKALSNKSHLREKQQPGQSFPDVHPGLTSYESWGSVDIAGPVKALILSDVHIPYHDSAALTVAVEKGKEAGVNLVLLNGDTMDCFEQSKFQPDPRKCDFVGALEKGRECIRWLRSTFPDARIIYKEGNHDERLERYFATRAPAVLGVEDFELKNLLRLDDSNVEYIGDNRPIRLGKLHVIHGHEFRLMMFNPVNPARGLFLRAKVHAMCGHFHQISEHSERTLEQTVLATWSTGCLCDLHPEYRPINNWAHGAAIVDVDENGRFDVTNFKIIDGRIY